MHGVTPMLRRSTVLMMLGCMLAGPLESHGARLCYIPIADDSVRRESNQREDGLRRTALHPDKFDRLKYTFDDVSSEDPACEAKNEAQSPRLDYHPVEPLHVKEGRLPGSRAVRLDRGYYSMPAPKVDPEEGFGFAVWVRLLGHGSEDGNGRPNGMLLAAGDGYWSGFRAYVDADRRTPRFQIGRPKPRSAVSATGEPVLQRGVWTHVVGSWDGHMMRLYVNGMLVAENAYDGPYTPPSSGTLRVGFAGAGVGSNLMDIDQFDFHGRPITAEEAIALALAPEPVDRNAAKRIAAANQALRNGEPKEARDRLRAVVSDETLDPGARTLARILLGDVLSHLQRNAKAVDVYVNVYRTAAAPRWKKTAAARLLPKATDPSQIGGAVPVRAPVEVYRELYESTDGEMHTVVGPALAEALVRSGRTDAAGGGAMRATDVVHFALADRAVPGPWSIGQRLIRVLQRADDIREFNVSGDDREEE